MHPPKPFVLDWWGGGGWQGPAAVTLDLPQLQADPTAGLR